MQATLLSIAIALILALLAALVGPHYVDWNKYRQEFETQASRMTGMQVRIAGPIDARLLPSPSLTLQRVDLARAGEVGTLRARRLSIEFSLGALARGEFKANEVIVEGAEVTATLDRDGQVDWPAPSIGFDPDAISIERLDVRDSRALLADTASGYGVVLDKFEFKGELRTLAGPVKGQGSFTVNDVRVPYRVAASRVGDGRVRVRLAVEPIDSALTADIDTTVSLERGVPRFFGTVNVARPLTRAPAGSSAEILEPWRLSGKIDGNSARAVIEQIEFQYGPDERPIRLRGDARVQFGAAPRMIGVLSSPQVDVDRILALPDPARRQPAAVLKALAEIAAGWHRPPIPVSLGITVEGLQLAGGTLQRLTADLVSEAGGWNIERLDVRAPGISQLALSGRLRLLDDASFAGRVRLSSKDPRTLVAWLTDRQDAFAASGLGLEGDVRLSRREIAIERFRSEIDRTTLEGRFAYTWPDATRPSRLEASLTAPEVDVDRLQHFVDSLTGGAAFDWPREGLIAAKIERALIAGVEARGLDINLRFGAQGFDMERIAIGEFGGAAVTLSGKVETGIQGLRGSAKFDLAGSRLDGVIAVLDRVAPAAAVELRRNASQLAPAKFSGAIDLGGGASTSRFVISGTAGSLRVAVAGVFRAMPEVSSRSWFAQLGSALTGIDMAIDTPDAAALAALLRLDRLMVVRGPGRATLSLKGAFDGRLDVDGRLVADALDVSLNGEWSASDEAVADLRIKVARADARMPSAANLSIASLTTSGSARLALRGRALEISELAGTIGGTEIGGHLKIVVGDAFAVDGDLRVGAVPLPAIIAAAIGVPKVVGGLWPAEPFERGFLGEVEGTIRLAVARASLSPQLAVSNLRTVVQMSRRSLTLEAIEGGVAGGRIIGVLGFEQGDEGLSLDGQIRIAGAALIDLLPGDGALSGRLTMELDLQGTGRSPVALIGGLKGAGSFTVQDGSIRRLDPTAFAAVIRNVDQGLPIDVTRIRDRMEAAFAASALGMALAQGEIAVAAGQLRIANVTMQAGGADVTTSLSLDLAAGALDARLTLAPVAAFAAVQPEIAARPEVIVTLRGPFGDLSRTLDVTSFVQWLAARAIDERNKRIDALQSGRDLPDPPAQPVAAPAATGPATIPRPAPQAPVKPAPPRPPAAKLAPPTDIRPPAATKPQTPAPKQAQPQRPAVRSWLENLLGP